MVASPAVVRGGACVKCGQTSHGDACASITKCHNCSEGHLASSRDCFDYKLQQETVAVQTREMISCSEAREPTTDKVVRPKQSYASVTAVWRTQVTHTAPSHIKDPQGTRQDPEQRTDARNAVTAGSTPISLTPLMISQVALPLLKPAKSTNPTSVKRKKVKPILKI